MLNFQGAVHQDSVLLTHAPPLGWVSFPRKTWVSFNYKSIRAVEAGLDELTDQELIIVESVIDGIVKSKEEEGK